MLVVVVEERAMDIKIERMVKFSGAVERLDIHTCEECSSKDLKCE